MSEQPPKRFPYRGKQVRAVGTGSSREDATFTLDNVGTVNVSELSRAIGADPTLAQYWSSPITQQAVEAVRSTRDIDPGRLASMTADELEQRAALAIQMPTGEVEIIDGNHYLLKCAELGRAEFLIVVVPLDVARRYLVRYEWLDGKVWKAIPEAEILAATRGRYWRPDGTVVDAAGTVVHRRRK